MKLFHKVRFYAYYGYRPLQSWASAPYVRGVSQSYLVPLASIDVCMLLLAAILCHVFFLKE